MSVEGTRTSGSRVRTPTADRARLLPAVASGDPLSVKATPDMSLRFLDETYAEANATIKEIQLHLEAFYRARDTPLARSGLAALSSCWSAPLRESSRWRSPSPSFARARARRLPL